MELLLDGKPSGQLSLKSAFLPAGKLMLVCEAGRGLRETSAAGRMDPYVIFKAEGQVRRPSCRKFVITRSTIGFISAGFCFLRGELVTEANAPPEGHTYVVAPRYIHPPDIGDLSPLSHIGRRKKKEIGLFGMGLCMVRESSWEYSASV